MWKCPVCERENNTLLCPHCGFDRSCDYEAYPSLKAIPQKLPSIRGRQAILTDKDVQTRLLLCPVCNAKNGTLLCPHCGFDGSCDYESYPTLGWVPWQSRSRAGYHKPLEKQETDSPSGISSAGRDATENIKKKQEELAKKRQEEQAKKQQEEQAKKLKKADKPFLWLGWASLVAIPYLLIFVVSPVSKLFYFLIMMEPVTLLVQLHLRRHGLSRIFRNEKASKVFRTACTWISVILAFPMMLIIGGFIREILEILVDGARLSGSNLWNLFSMTIPTIYYLLLAQFYSIKG